MCTSSGNKQKVRHFRTDCVSTLCVELNGENCKEFAIDPFRVMHRTNGFTVYSACQTNNETTGFATEPACSSDRPTTLTLRLSKQHVDTRYSCHIRMIFTHDIHWINVFKTQESHHGKQRHQPFEIYFAQIFVGLQLKICKPREFYSIETFWRRDYLFTRTHTVNRPASKLYLSFPSSDKSTAIDNLNADLECVSRWCCQNSLLINPDKTKVLIIGMPQLLNKLPTVSVRMLGKEITPVIVAKDLGLYIDQSLTYNDHITKTVSTCLHKLIQINTS